MHTTLYADATKPSFFRDFVKPNVKHISLFSLFKKSKRQNKQKTYHMHPSNGILQSTIFGEKWGKMHLIKLQADGEVLRQFMYGLD